MEIFNGRDQFKMHVQEKVEKVLASLSHSMPLNSPLPCSPPFQLHANIDGMCML